MNRKIFIFAIMAVAALVALFPSLRRSDQLTVHLVDKRTGKPVRSYVAVRESRPYPILSSMHRLPDWLRGSTKTYSVKAQDGIFRIHRIKGTQRQSFLMIEEVGVSLLYYHDKNNGDVIVFWRAGDKAIPIGPRQTQVSVPVDSPPHNDGPLHEPDLDSWPFLTEPKLIVAPRNQ